MACARSGAAGDVTDAVTPVAAVVGVAMAYFAYVMANLSFDVLAAVNGVEVCLCRSSFLARLVWESQFLSQWHKPLWAKLLSWIGV